VRVLLTGTASLRTRLCATCAVLLLAVLSACDDGPTAPGVYTHPVNGHVWAAVIVPETTPELRTWLPYLRPSSAEAEATLQQVRSLHADAEKQRRLGNLEAAREKEEAATLLAARSLTHTPATHVLLTSLSALNLWADRAAFALAGGEFPELGASAREVRARRAAAAEALQLGDTTSAVVELTLASAVIRAHSPGAMAYRALEEAERRVAEQSPSDPDAARATRLLRNAREALASGDDKRALRRALYALQLADSQTTASPAMKQR
jgi:hypothetical protein